MTPPIDLPSLSHAEKDALIVALLARVDALVAEVTALQRDVAELRFKLDLPPKTPDNSSTPPSRGQKPSQAPASKDKRKAHPGAHRRLHPNPTSRRDLFASSCRHCGADVSARPQCPREAYDHVEIPDIEPDVTRVTLHGGSCSCCAKSFKAPAPDDMPRGSPPELVEGRA